MKRKKILLILLFALVIMSSQYFPSVFAGTTGKIVGQVIDADAGIGLPGANVVIVGTTMGAATDLNGDFMILRLPPGTYNLKVSMMGYQTQLLQNVSVNVDLTTKVSFSLSMEALDSGEEVVIIATREMITKDMTGSQSTVGADEIETLPVEEFSDIVQLQAGVVQGRDGNIHIRGGRTEEVTYMVDGVAMSDVFSGQLAVEVENSSVQELQVISGTFNAEYGRAMSGVINIITKDGGDKLSGSATFYAGDFLSGANDVFPHIDDFDPFGVINGQFSLQGTVPFTNKNLRFFLTARYLNDDGYIFGTRLFNPTDVSNFRADNPDDWDIEQTGDGKAVPMQPRKKITTHGKLSYRFSPSMKLSTSLMLDDVKTRNWSKEGSEHIPENQFHDFYHFMFNPDGASYQYQNGYTFLSTWDQMLNARTFYTLNFSLIQNEEKSYVYEDAFDSRYLKENRLQNISYGNAFYTGGTDLWHSQRKTRTFVTKVDLTSQATNTHQLKSGLEFRAYKLDFSEFKIIPAKDENGIEIKPFKPALPTRASPYHNRYTHSPYEFALYLQDKMEFDFMIVNVGLRYDLFNPNAQIPTDSGDPGNPNKRKAAGIQNQFSPRLGIAYPISDRGVLHFSYGYFFQMPLFQYLYANSEYEVEIGRLKTLMGNADLSPQKTIIYEVGLQQQLTDNLAFDFTVYYKDIRDLLGTEIYETTEGADRYALYVNRDFGATRGFVFALNQRHSQWLSAGVDYTFQIAEGNASEPNASFIDRQSNRESEKHLVPLDWDQRHTLNASLTITPSRQSGITLLGCYGSGLPYTPTFLNIRRAFENTGRSRPTLNLDLKAHYILKIAGLNYSFFLKVFNLLDRRDEVIVYRDTGRAGYTVGSRLTGIIRGVNTIDDYFNNPPHHFSAPRQVRIGVTVAF